MSGGGAIAGRLRFAVLLVLALSPACESQRLVLVNVDRARPSLSDGVVIASLEARTSPLFNREPTVLTRGDASNTNFPKLLGVYLHPRSEKVSIRVFAYRDDGKLVAAGQIDNVDTGREQVEHDLLLYPCSGPAPDKTTLCEMPPTPDGGDGGMDADTGMGVIDAMDVRPTDAPEVGDGPLTDRSDSGDTPEDQRMDLVDATDAADAEVHIDTAPDFAEAGDTRDGNPEVSPDAPDGSDGGVIPAACKTYCTALLKACSYPFLGQRQCELSCAYAQLAPSDGTLGDALSCRIDSLPRPSDSPAQVNTACHAASLLSDDCPPGPCFVYCVQGATECADQGFSFADCFNNCFGVPLPTGDVESPRSDDSIACRMSWLEVAMDDPSMCARGLPLLPVPCQAQ